MKQNRKHLKVSSALILIFSALTFVRMAGEFLFTDSGTAMLPDGFSTEVEWIVRVLLVAVTFVYLLPSIYVGAKGVRIAKGARAAGWHIVWAYILVIFAVWGLIEPVKVTLQRGTAEGNVHALLRGVVSLFLYFYYIRSAKAVAKAARASKIR